MKYLKLFEDHKETSDKIAEIENNAKLQTEEVINQYKELIDEMMYDITDDYETQSVINIINASGPHCKTYLDYLIRFTADKYEDVLDKLLEVVDRLKDAYGVSYKIRDVFTQGGQVNSLTALPGRISYYRNPFDFYEAKKVIKNHIDRTAILHYKKPSDIKLAILISF